MNNKNTKTILFAGLIAALILPFPGMNNAYAEHPLPTDNPFSTGTQSICLDLTQMNLVNVDGSTNNELIIYNSASNAINMYNSQTVMNLAYYPSQICGDGINMIGSYPHGIGVQGAEWDIDSSMDSHHVVIQLNSDRNYNSLSTCGWFEDVNQEYIFNHEIGHFAELDHTVGWFVDDDHSLMKPNCNNGYSSLTVDDITQINGFYTVHEDGVGNE